MSALNTAYSLIRCHSYVTLTYIIYSYAPSSQSCVSPKLFQVSNTSEITSYQYTKLLTLCHKPNSPIDENSSLFWPISLIILWDRPSALIWDSSTTQPLTIIPLYARSHFCELNIASLSHYSIRTELWACNCNSLAIDLPMATYKE